jgi:hypothetical protein
VPELAGLVSTADDLHAFARMLLRGRAPVLPARRGRAMTTGQLTAAQKSCGGLMPGFFNGRSWGARHPDPDILAAFAYCLTLNAIAGGQP